MISVTITPKTWLLIDAMQEMRLADVSNSADGTGARAANGGSIQTDERERTEQSGRDQALLPMLQLAATLATKAPPRLHIASRTTYGL